jgi:hypothetical protein
MNKKRKISRWDRRRANKRLKRLQEEDKYKKTVHNADVIDIELPELNKKQRSKLEEDIKDIKSHSE